MVGISGSGKSTWATNFASQFNNQYVIVNKDKIRKMVNPNYPKTMNFKIEPYVDEIQSHMIEALKLQHLGIIVDNTHCRVAYITSLVEKLEGYNVWFKLVDTPFEEACERVRQRDSIDPIEHNKRFKQGFDIVKEYLEAEYPEQIITE